MVEIKSMTYEQARRDYFELEMQRAQNRIEHWKRKLEKAKSGTAQIEAHKNASDAGWEYNFYKDALEALEAAKDTKVPTNQPKWISVEERLPGHGAGMFFIVCRDDGAVHEARFEISNGRWYELTTEGLWEIDVNHWIPLPEPPKEG